MKGDENSITIPKEEYRDGLASCQQNFMSQLKLEGTWKINGSWSIVPLGRGYFEFSFSNDEDLKTILAASTRQLNPGILGMFLWPPDFNPLRQNYHSHVQVWVRILGLSLQILGSRILIAIANGIGTLLELC
ncbi:hypothetical protein PHAVU_009G209000 [Phaseolus vulgaris]|uniref:Uncharacterized protein n=1 Tax=Phaseolus vulgaris TaxID=3885 RepID=V7AXR1_PHAVU|nr:hypothetical protein PHAVU_009G209000g [Phaseolus vulgaris]ESW10432.1 hypothetical protein PHAVU_009G209000g [Phaseolus vulgaris]